MIADMIHNKKLNSIVTKLFIRGRKLNISSTNCNKSSDINTKDFANIYRKCTNEPYSFLVIDTMLASNNPLRFRKNLFNIHNKNHDN